MILHDLDHAISEAERFLRVAKNLKERDKERRGENYVYIQPSKESGATRRASMDLTRALAELRRT